MVLPRHKRRQSFNCLPTSVSRKKSRRGKLRKKNELAPSCRGVDDNSQTYLERSLGFQPREASTITPGPVSNVEEIIQKPQKPVITLCFTLELDIGTLYTIVKNIIRYLLYARNETLDIGPFYNPYKKIYIAVIYN